MHRSTIGAFLHDEDGATAIEYGLIAVLVALGIIGGLTAFGQAMNNMFSGNGTSLAAAVNSAGS